MPLAGCARILRAVNALHSCRLAGYLILIAAANGAVIRANVRRDRFYQPHHDGETVLLGRFRTIPLRKSARWRAFPRVTIWSACRRLYADLRSEKMAACCRCCSGRAASWRVWRPPVLHARTLRQCPAAISICAVALCYTPDQGSTRIERVLASGTGARIVTSHDDIRLIEFQVPASQISGWRIKSSTTFKTGAGVRWRWAHRDRQLLQFCYTAEVAIAY